MTGAHAAILNAARMSSYSRYNQQRVAYITGRPGDVQGGWTGW